MNYFKWVSVPLFLALGLLVLAGCPSNYPAAPSNIPTSTPTITGTPTASPTITLTPLAPPSFSSNYAAAGSPNGFYFDGNNLTVAESGGTTVGMIETYQVGTGTLTWLSSFNTAVRGIPSFQQTPALHVKNFQLNLPQQVAVSGNRWGLLDNQANGGATLWSGDKNFWPSPDYGFRGPYEYSDVGYSGLAFSHPMGFAADSLGNFYVANTGNGDIESFVLSSPFHRWTGWFTGSGSMTFIQPHSVACDSNNDVWVGDSGYSPSKLVAFTSGATTCLGSWDLIPGCVINGLAVDSSGSGAASVYVSDTGNGGQVEVYLIQPYPLSTLGANSCNLIRSWGDPHGPHETQAFSPSCIVRDTVHQQTLVGDKGNDLIQVFGP